MLWDNLQRQLKTGQEILEKWTSNIGYCWLSSHGASRRRWRPLKTKACLRRGLTWGWGRRGSKSYVWPCLVLRKPSYPLLGLKGKLQSFPCIDWNWWVPRHFAGFLIWLKGHTQWKPGRRMTHLLPYLPLTTITFAWTLPWPNVSWVLPSEQLLTFPTSSQTGYRAPPEPYNSSVPNSIWLLPVSGAHLKVKLSRSGL